MQRQLPGEQSPESLDFSRRPCRGHAFSRLNGCKSSDAKIIGGGPNPEAVWIGGIGCERNQNVSLPGGAHVARSFFGCSDNRNMLSRERGGNLRNVSGLLELQIYRERVSMKNRRLQNLHGREEHFAICNFAIVPCDSVANG